MLTSVELISVPDESAREAICEYLDQYYWNDNGGETDGCSYLIEASDLPYLADGMKETQGTHLSGYNPEIHKDILDALQVPWTGWQAEGYALIAASVAIVEQAFMEVANGW